MDDKDRELIHILQQDGRKSLTDIGKELGMSHVAIGKRLNKLREEDSVQISAGVRAESLDIKIVFMGLETRNMEVADGIAEKYGDCPRLLMLAPVTGRYNLFAVMIAEDTWSMESMVGTCSMATEEGIRNTETWLGNAPIVPEYLSIDLAPNRDNGERSPCGRHCPECKRYKIERCVGCPKTPAYKGNLWIQSKNKE
jgi:DNA-binding Lrp family transcriptional regulator